MGMQAAIDAPKISFVEPNQIRAEGAIPKEIIEALKAKGHEIIEGSIGNAHGIVIRRDEAGNISGYDAGVDERSKKRAPIMDR